LPFLAVSLKTLKPKEKGLERRTLGEHIRQHRLKLGMTQRQVATKLQVNPWTVLNWERGHTKPPIAVLPAIIRWLGYDPFPPPKTLVESLLAKRRAMGWSMKEAAHQLGVDEGTWAAWEKGAASPRGRYARVLQAFL